MSLNSTEMFHSSSNRPGPEGRTHSEIRMMTMFSITKSSCLGIEITSYKLFPWNFSFLSSCLCKKWENCKLNGNKWKSRWEEIERLREGESDRVWILQMFVSLCPAPLTSLSDGVTVTSYGRFRKITKKCGTFYTD